VIGINNIIEAGSGGGGGHLRMRAGAIRSYSMEMEITHNIKPG
jgi:hypothetical protein